MADLTYVTGSICWSLPTRPEHTCGILSFLRVNQTVRPAMYKTVWLPFVTHSCHYIDHSQVWLSRRKIWAGTDIYAHLKDCQAGRRHNEGRVDVYKKVWLRL